MTRTFRISTGWKIFAFIVVPFIIAFFVWMAQLPFDGGKINWFRLFTITPLSIVMISYMIYGLIDTVIGYHSITPTSFGRKTPFRTTTFLLNDISGYREIEGSIYLFLRDRPKKKIKVTRYIADYDIFQAWLISKFDNLDQVQEAREQLEILKDADVGANVESREHRLIEAKWAARIINFIGVAIGVWVFLIPRPYTVALYAGLLTPIIVIAITRFYNGVIRFSPVDGSAYPSIGLGFLVSALGIFMRGLRDFDILYYSNIWNYAFGVMIVILAFMVTSTKEFKFSLKPNGGFLALAFIVFCYAFGATASVNCAFDHSKPRIFQAQVLEKNFNDGKVSTYYLRVSPWGSLSKPENVRVSRKHYESADKGDLITIYQRKGKLNAPWYEVEVK